MNHKNLKTNKSMLKLKMNFGLLIRTNKKEISMTIQNNKTEIKIASTI